MRKIFENNNLRNTAALLAIILFMTLAVPDRAIAVELPADSLAKLLLKTLTMETGDKTGQGADYRITILDKATPGSFSADLAKELAGAGVAEVRGLPLKVDALATGDFAKAIEAGAKVIVVCDLDGQALENIVAAAEKAGILTLAMDSAWVQGGMVMGIFLEGARPKIHVNITAANKTGLVFKSQLLKISNIIK